VPDHCKITDAAISPQPIQLQLYGYNDIYSQILGVPLVRLCSYRCLAASRNGWSLLGYLHLFHPMCGSLQSATGRGGVNFEGRLNE
jgi:hypothetical protein